MMLHSRFFWRLYAGYVVLILLSAAIVGGLIAVRITEDTVTEIRSSLKARTLLLRELSLSSFVELSSGLLQDRIETLGEKTNTRFTVILFSGRVIADSDKDPALMDNHGSRPEVLSALADGIGTSTRFSHTIGTKMMYLALPMFQNDNLVGYVRSSLPLFEIDNRLKHLRIIIFFGSAASAFVALILGFFVATAFVKPIISMAKIAESMPLSDYKARLPITWRDETGKLASAMNRMAESCQERLETISTDKNKLLTILSGMSEGVIAVDRDEKILHLNGAAKTILGVSDYHQGRPLWEVTRVGEVCKIISDVLKNKNNLVRELSFIAPAKDKVVSLNASALRDSNGEIAGAILVVHDISELHRLEVVRRDFVANASHELKTPITAIRNIIETIIEDNDMQPEARSRFLLRAMKQTIRLSSLVGDLLTISRLEADRFEAVPETFDLRDVIATSINALSPIGIDKGIDITTCVPHGSEPVLVTGDEGSLCQAVSNLLDNALKYTDEGGRIWVKLSQENSNGENSAVIEIRDTGIGISPGEINRIFERFYRVDKARSRELGGTGLGLSIVKHIVLAHNGMVTVQSVVGNGSSFHITLPVTSNQGLK